MRNGKRPINGSFAMDDNVVALRVSGWLQHKMKVDRSFYRESTDYDNYQGGGGRWCVFPGADLLRERDRAQPSLCRINPSATRTIVNRMIPKILWEYEGEDENATWFLTDIS